MRILDSKYEKADLRQTAADATSLDEKQKGELYELLMELEDLFDGTLGDWKTKLVELELNKGIKARSHIVQDIIQCQECTRPPSRRNS
jgi:hypothetical protein